MALTRATIGWHAASIGAGGLAVFTAMATQQVDVYAVWQAMNKVVADVTALLAALAPIAAIFGAAYRTWNAKQVPAAALVVDTGSTSKAETDAEHPPGNSATVSTVNGTAVGKIVGALLIGFIVLTAASSAYAQTIKRPQVTGHLFDDIKANSAAGTTPNQNMMAMYEKLQTVSLVDLKYALNIATKKNNVAAAQCWTAIITQIEQDQTANLDANGQPLPTPDPHLFTDVERLSDVINSLGPNSPLMVGCGSFANQAKMNVVQLISTILAGGAGLAAFVP